MGALPADIARFTSDGTLITKKDQAIKDRDPNALDTGDREVAMFFDDPNHGDIIATELFAYVSTESRPHEGIEVGDVLGLGTSFPVFPRAPLARVIDKERGINGVCAVRQYAFDMSSDSYAIELVGIGAIAGDPPSFDETDITLDNTPLSWDSDYSYSA